MTPTAGWPLERGVQRGLVSAFDVERGVGCVRAEDGSSYDFHCTSLSDGTRDVEVGRPVEFAVMPAHGGRLEARRIAKR
jgi:cold shock CspA family protein